MRAYVLSLSVGTLVGVIYALLNVRSPAPPVVALMGLLGILLGEQIVPIAKRLISGERITAAWAMTECVPHMFGPLPGRAAPSQNAQTAIREICS